MQRALPSSAFSMLPASNEYFNKGTQMIRAPFFPETPKPLSEDELINPNLAGQNEVVRNFSSMYQYNNMGI